MNTSGCFHSSVSIAFTGRSFKSLKQNLFHYQHAFNRSSTSIQIAPVRGQKMNMNKTISMYWETPSDRHKKCVNHMFNVRTWMYTWHPSSNVDSHHDCYTPTPVDSVKVSPYPFTQKYLGFGTISHCLYRKENSTRRSVKYVRVFGCLRVCFFVCVCACVWERHKERDIECVCARMFVCFSVREIEQKVFKIIK